MSRPDGSIRRARPDEAEALTGLFWRSKAHWGYDEAFMARVRETLRITPEIIEQQHVYVLETDGRIAGFYALHVLPDRLHLEDLFIEPDQIGMGYGRRLFDHAVEVGRRLGYDSFTLESDPNAEEFYLKLGAIRVGEHESAIPGRFIPHLLVRFSPAAVPMSEERP
ncbi:MAG: GNAT family N-acetyltransferase [Anaerolineae bacterium]|nr:GNAT family N-acetyltransferase [Anaerolineae bacterium]